MTAQRYISVAHSPFHRSDTDTCYSDTDTFMKRYITVQSSDTDQFTERYILVSHIGNLKVIPKRLKKDPLRAPLPFQIQAGVSNVQ